MVVVASKGQYYEYNIRNGQYFPKTSIRSIYFYQMALLLEKAVKTKTFFSEKSSQVVAISPPVNKTQFLLRTECPLETQPTYCKKKNSSAPKKELSIENKSHFSHEIHSCFSELKK